MNRLTGRAEPPETEQSTAAGTGPPRPWRASASSSGKWGANTHLAGRSERQSFSV